MAKTIGETMKLALKATNQTEADNIVQDLIQDDVEWENKPMQERESILRQNIGHCSGYYDRKTSVKLIELYRTQHPVFGKTYPKPSEAFQAGVKHVK